MGFSVGALLTAAGGAAQAYGSVRQGNYARDAAYTNAGIMDEQAANRLRAGTLREDMTRYQARQVIGEQLAAGGESGVGLSGSRLDTLRQSYDNLESDTAAIRTDSLIDATGLKNQAILERWYGDQAQSAGRWGAIGAGLNTFAALNSTTDVTDPQSGRLFKADAQEKYKPSFTSRMLKTNSYARRGRF